MTLCRCRFYAGLPVAKYGLAASRLLDVGSKLSKFSRQHPSALWKSFYSTSCDPDFVPIYKFPYIVQATAICRLKLYQTSITIAMVPTTLMLYGTEMATASQCQTTIAMSCFACAILYIMGGFFRRLVGIMYLNKTRDTVKLAHLTFTGRRREVLAPVEDIVPFADVGDRADKVYYPLKFYSNDQYYYYIVRYGGILQPDLFKLVFGEEVMERVKIKKKN